VLWGKGGRGILVSCIAAFALAAPMAALADSGKGSSGNSGVIASSFIAPSLLNATGKVDVIIQSSGGTSDAVSKTRGLGVFQKDMKQLGLIGAVEAVVPASQLKKLAGVPGLIVTPNADVKLAGQAKTSQLWPYESGNAELWAGDAALYAGKMPAIAIVDSGIQQRGDFGNRLIASVNLSTIAGNTSMDDQRGHGTFVAGIAAGAGSDLAGAAPGAPLVSVKVMNDKGQAKTSDVVNAAQWILDNKDKYNIRVANFSLHSSYSTNFYRDPLDQAVEKLWFGGVVVVAASGNYGSATAPSGVLYAPGNDPFVITVGAIDLGNSIRANDDTVAPWSAYGYTPDGFYKPDVAAPGRYMVGPVPAGSTLTVEKASNLVGKDRIQLSGTSFAAPIVAGTAAQMLARHPGWTPDQVKGVLMRTARVVRRTPEAAGVGEITASRAAAASYAPNPNLGLERFFKSNSGGSGQSFDAMSWANAAKTDMSWNSMSWTSQSWSDQSWSDQSWASMSWADMSWNSMSWTDMSWTDMSWADVSSEDAAEGDDIEGVAGYEADPADIAEAASDPSIAITVDGIDPLAALGVTAPTEAAAPVATTATTAVAPVATAAVSTVTSLLP
jgi:serine protease AprX